MTCLYPKQGHGIHFRDLDGEGWEWFWASWCGLPIEEYRARQAQSEWVKDDYARLS